jgi:nucleotide-binding universal stress UspA family protein
MSVVLAALDSSALAEAVLEIAARFARLTGADVEVISVRNVSGEPLKSIASDRVVPFRLFEGPVAPSLLAALGAHEVIAAVIGARATPDDRRPVGRTAHQILGHAHKPVVVVTTGVVSPGSFQRLLVPLEGTEASSRAVLEQLCPLLVTEVELIVLHAFTEATVPAMLDRPGYDIEILGQEFRDRHCPYSTRVEFCVGPVAKRVAEVSRDLDLVVLSWSQDSSPERAHTIREVLDASAVPVLLLATSPLDAQVPGRLYARSSLT